MMKIKYTIIIILITAFLSGCANDRYSIEKRYWQIKKQAEQIFTNPNASPPNELERVVKLLSGFAFNHPKSNLAVEAEFTIARLYMAKKEFDKARSQLKLIMTKYEKNVVIPADALFLIGNSYEIQDKWPQALEQYKKVINDYVLTPIGFSTPVYIAQYYKLKHQPEKMLQAYQDAVVTYNGLAQKYPDTPLGYKASVAVAECYIQLKDWQNTIATLGKIIQNYKDKVRVDGLMLNMASIYAKELKDNLRAAQTLQDLKKDYPKSRMLKAADAMLKEINKK